MLKILIILGLNYSLVTLSDDLTKCNNGWSETEKGNYLQAVNLFEECINVGNLSNENIARTYRNIGITYNRSGQYKLAIESYDKALSLNPPDPWFDYVNRGNAWSGLKKYEKAMDEYQLALQVKENFNEAHYNMGIVYERQGNKLQAIHEFKTAYEFGLRSEALYNRFVAYDLIKESQNNE